MRDFYRNGGRGHVDEDINGNIIAGANENQIIGHSVKECLMIKEENFHKYGYIITDQSLVEEGLREMTEVIQKTTGIIILEIKNGKNELPKGTPGSNIDLSLETQFAIIEPILKDIRCNIRLFSNDRQKLIKSNEHRITEFNNYKDYYGFKKAKDATAEGKFSLPKSPTHFLLFGEDDTQLACRKNNIVNINVAVELNLPNLEKEKKVIDEYSRLDLPSPQSIALTYIMRNALAGIFEEADMFNYEDWERHYTMNELRSLHLLPSASHYPLAIESLEENQYVISKETILKEYKNMRRDFEISHFRRKEAA
ncbi:MAG TPA: hypothetical protein VLG12_06615 [Candidatus Saccharimonadales bacterium]|nr:hypothetical protein [Candidatus Saccharimonadales bacterium]